MRLNPVLEAKHSNTVTNAKKQHIWRNITDKVNVVVSQRTVQEVKDKWRNVPKS